MKAEYPSLVANLALVTRSREEAEDAVQEALARVWALSDRGDSIHNLRAWTGVVAINIVRSRFRRLLTERRTRILLGGGTSSDAAIEGAPLAQEELADLKQAVLDLPRRQREVTVLHYFLDLEVREVSRVLGISVGTVKKALHRAREALLSSLGAPEEEANVEYR